MLFVLRPDPNRISLDARTFAEAEVQRRKNFVTAAQNRIRIEEARYEENPTWESSARMARVEDQLEEFESLLAEAVRKLEWEARREWMRAIKVNTNAMPTPWKNDTQHWLSIFKPRQTKPNQ